MINSLSTLLSILFTFLFAKNALSQQLCDNFGWTNIDGHCFRPFIYFVDNDQAKQLCEKVGGDVVSFIEEALPEYAHLVADELRVAHELRLGMPGKKNGVLCKKPANNGKNNELFDKICPDLATKWPIARQQMLSPPMTAAQPLIKLSGPIGQLSTRGMPGMAGLPGVPGLTVQQSNGGDELGQPGTPGEPGLPGQDGQSSRTRGQYVQHAGLPGLPGMPGRPGQSASRFEIEDKNQQLRQPDYPRKQPRQPPRQMWRQTELGERGDNGQREHLRQGIYGRYGHESTLSDSGTDERQQKATHDGRNENRDRTHSKSYASSSTEHSGHRHRNGGARSDTSVVVQIGYPFGGPSPSTAAQSNAKPLASSDLPTSSSSSSATHSSSSNSVASLANREKVMGSSTSARSTQLETADRTRNSDDFEYSDDLSNQLDNNYGHSLGTSSSKLSDQIEASSSIADQSSSSSSKSVGSSSSAASLASEKSSIAFSSGGLNEANAGDGPLATDVVDYSASSSSNSVSSSAVNAQNRNSTSSSSYVHKKRQFTAENDEK